MVSASNNNKVVKGSPVPDRLLNQAKNTALKVIGVDMKNKHVLVHFDDDITANQRKRLSFALNKLPKSTSALNLSVYEIREGDLVIVGDVCGNFHRLIVPDVQTLETGTLCDADTNDKFQMDKMLILKITPDLNELFLQIVKCEVSICDTNEVREWKANHDFVSTLLEKTLLSAIEMLQNRSIQVASICRTNAEDVLKITVDVFESEEMRDLFIQSLVFFTIPRIPMVDQAKLAVITNVCEGDNGDLSVVIHDNVAFAVATAIKSFQHQYSKKVLGQDSDGLGRFYKEMVHSYTIRNFLAPVPGDLSTLHRVRVVGMEFDHVVKVFYLDLGKEMSIPSKHLTVPLRSVFLPELFKHIKPQAIKIRLDKFKTDNSNVLKNLCETLQGKPCYIKTVSDANKGIPPLVEVWTDVEKDIVSLNDYIQSLNSSNVLNPLPTTNYTVDALRAAAVKWETFKGCDLSDIIKPSKLTNGEVLTSETESIGCDCLEEDLLDGYDSDAQKDEYVIPSN